MNNKQVQGMFSTSVGRMVQLGLSVTLVGVGAVLADVQLNTFQPNSVLRAADLNANFEALRETRAANGARYSNFGTFCGRSANHSGQLAVDGMSGYRAAKRICEQTCGQATAHLCSTEEVIRHAQVDGTFGGTPDAGVVGWYATGVDVIRDNGAGHMRDCTGFTSTSGEGLVWDAPSGFPNNAFCSGTAPLLCCN